MSTGRSIGQRIGRVGPREAGFAVVVDARTDDDRAGVVPAMLADAAEARIGFAGLGFARTVDVWLGVGVRVGFAMVGVAGMVDARVGLAAAGWGFGSRAVCGGAESASATGSANAMLRARAAAARTSGARSSAGEPSPLHAAGAPSCTRSALCVPGSSNDSRKAGKAARGRS